LGSGDSDALSINDLEAAIVIDPELSLRTLALANSAFYSQQHEISALRSAVVVLGADAVHNLAASMLARSLHSSPSVIDESLWQHCQVVAVAGQMLAETHGQIGPNQAFAAGLLHDIGILAIRNADGSDGEYLIEHAAVGAEIADLLGLSPSLSEAIKNHDAAHSFNFSEAPLEATVSLANHLAERCGYAYFGESVSGEDLVCSLVANFKLKDSDIDALADGLYARLEKLQGMSGDQNGNSDMTEAKAQILFVDNEQAILNSLQRLFRPTGHHISIANSGAEGLSLLQQQEIDIVISDRRMPNMDGAQFLTGVAKKWPATVRMLLTGYADLSSAIDVVNNGAIARYLTKSWQDADIVMCIEQAIENKRLVQDKARLEALTTKQNEDFSRSLR